MKKPIIAILSLSLALTACANDQDSKVESNSGETIESSEVESKKDQIGTMSEVKKEGDKYQVVVYDYFDTVTTFTAYAESDEEFDQYKSLLNDKMEYYHKLFNSYDKFEDFNNFYTINQEAGKNPVKVDQEALDLVKEGKRWYEETDGKIDIGAGSLLKIWSDFRDSANEDPDKAELPQRSVLEEAAGHIDIDAIEIDEEESTVFINDPDVQIDIGAIGKGYATELIKQDLIDQGLESGILSVGGDVAVIGEKPDGDSKNFVIAVEAPDKSYGKDYASVLYINNTSVVTSGDYQRYFEMDGRKYHHIIDKETLEPSTKWKSVTVIHDDIGEADAISTALFVMDRESGEELVNKYGGQAFWIDQDNKEYKTENYKKYEEK